jgi:hypothetical protein
MLAVGDRQIDFLLYEVVKELLKETPYVLPLAVMQIH